MSTMVSIVNTNARRFSAAIILIKQVNNLTRPIKFLGFDFSHLEASKQDRRPRQTSFTGLPDDEVHEEHDAEREVYLYCEQLVPGDALLHQLVVGVDDVEDDRHHVAEEHRDHQELARLGLPARRALRPVLQLHREGRGALQVIIVLRILLLQTFD